MSWTDTPAQRLMDRLTEKMKTVYLTFFWGGGYKNLMPSRCLIYDFLQLLLNTALPLLL